MNDTNNNLNNTPDYKDDYWMRDKANNLILKKIIDFLAGYGGYEGMVKPMLDSQIHVHLMVQRGNQHEEIVFGESFPNEAPKIEVTGGIDVNNTAKWHFNGDIYDSFVRYYDEYFKKETIVQERVFISEYEMREFVNSLQTVSLGSSFFDSSGLVYNPIEGEFTPRLILRFQPSSNPDKNNVLFFKGKAVDYKPNSYVVEYVESVCPKAFYVEDDGAKRELALRLL